MEGTEGEALSEQVSQASDRQGSHSLGAAVHVNRESQHYGTSKANSINNTHSTVIVSPLPDRPASPSVGNLALDDVVDEAEVGEDVDDSSDEDEPEDGEFAAESELPTSSVSVANNGESDDTLPSPSPSSPLDIGGVRRPASRSVDALVNVATYYPRAVDAPGETRVCHVFAFCFIIRAILILIMS